MSTVDDALAEAFGGVKPKKTLKKPESMQDTAKAIARKHGVDENIFLKLVNQESRFNNAAVSSKGALGLGQLMPDTAKELGVDPSDPKQNLEGSARYLKMQLDRFGDYKLALAAYNAGPKNVEKYGGIPPFPETQDYVQSILGDTTAVTPKKLGPPKISVDDALSQAFATSAGQATTPAPADLEGPAGPAEVGFMESLKQTPEALARLIVAGASPMGFVGQQGEHVADLVRAQGGDTEAEARLGGRGMVAGLVGAAIPGGPAGIGLRALGARAGLGAAGGALGAGLEAQAAGRPVLPAATVGGALGMVFNPLIGAAAHGVQGIVKARLAKRLAEMEMEARSGFTPPQAVKEIADLVRTSKELDPAVKMAPEPGAVQMPMTPEPPPRRVVGPTPEPGVVALPEPEAPPAGVVPEPGEVPLPTGRPEPIEPSPTTAGGKAPKSPKPPKALDPLVADVPERGFTPPQNPTAMDDVERFVRKGAPVPGEVADRAQREIATVAGAVGETPLQRVLDALKRAPRVISRQAKLHTLERGKRIAAARGARPVGTGGEAGFRTQLSKMAGEMTKLDFESLRPLIQQGDVDALFNQVDATPLLDDFEKLTASRGLRKLFGEMGGQVPSTDELRKLKQVFGDELIEELLDKRPTLDRMWDLGLKTLGGWRSVITSYDLSAPLNQGLFLGAGNPKEFAKAFFQMFRYAGSENAFKGLEANIQSRPTYLLMKRSGLGLSDMGHIMSDREEAFASDWAEKIPGVRHSNRAYVGFLNKLRADVFDKLVREAREAGIDPNNDLLYTKQIADFVNDATGRGKLGKVGKLDFARHADLLNAGFFSPRLMASRIRLLNPGLYVHSNPLVRKQALRSLFGMAAAGTTIMTLAKMAGADIETDPKTTDFGKIKVGDTRYDIFGGFSQYARAAANLMPFAGGPNEGTRLDYASRFLQSKASPAAGFALDLLRGSDFKGDPIATPQWVADRFVPMILQDLWDAQQEWGPQGMLMAAPAMFGVRIQTYD